MVGRHCLSNCSCVHNLNLTCQKGTIFLTNTVDIFVHKINKRGVYPVEKFFAVAIAKWLFFNEFFVKNMMKQYDCQENIKMSTIRLEIQQIFHKHSLKRRIIFGVILWTFLLFKAKSPFKNHHIDDDFWCYCPIGMHISWQLLIDKYWKLH